MKKKISLLLVLVLLTASLLAGCSKGNEANIDKKNSEVERATP